MTNEQPQDFTEKLPQPVAASLADLLQLLRENEAIADFQKIQQQVDKNPSLQHLTAEIKAAQKEAVAFQHYGKPEAEKIANQKAAEYTQLFNQHPLVVEYREALKEASELLQYVTTGIESQVNQRLLAEKDEN